MIIKLTIRDKRKLYGHLYCQERTGKVLTICMSPDFNSIPVTCDLSHLPPGAYKGVLRNYVDTTGRSCTIEYPSDDNRAQSELPLN